MAFDFHFWHGILPDAGNRFINIKVWTQAFISKVCKAEIRVLCLWFSIEMTDEDTALVIAQSALAAFYGEDFMLHEFGREELVGEIRVHGCSGWGQAKKNGAVS